ncbi:MAG: hypothetical protein WDO15_14595 [Bacteroidota bacterium]
MASQFEAKTYGNITLVLDLDTDAHGATPGCYVQTMDGVRYKLKNSADGVAEVEASRTFEVASNATTKVVLDFDIRKAITYDMDDAVRYKFVGDADLNGSVHLIVKEKAGSIKGILNNYLPSGSHKTVAYAYKKGTFSASTETQPQGGNQMYFMKCGGKWRSEARPEWKNVCDSIPGGGRL